MGVGLAESRITDVLGAMTKTLASSERCQFQFSEWIRMLKLVREHLEPDALSLTGIDEQVSSVVPS